MLEKQEEQVLDPYSMFMFAMKSPVTRRKYTGRLVRFLDFIGLAQGTIEQRCKNFTEKAGNDSKWPLNNIIRFLQSQKQKVEQNEITAATLNNYVKSIKLFCEVTEIPISWKNILRGLLKARRYADDRALSVNEDVNQFGKIVVGFYVTLFASGIRCTGTISGYFTVYCVGDTHLPC